LNFTGKEWTVMPTNPYPAERTSKYSRTSVTPGVVLNCLREKQLIIGELIAGRLPLIEAAEKFQAVHETSATHIENLSARTGVLVEPEGMCRTLIGWVHLSLSQRPEEAERVSERLECELQRNVSRSANQKFALCS